MAVTNEGSGGAAGKVPPRPGGSPRGARDNKAPVPPRPSGAPGTSGAQKLSGHPTPRVSARRTEQYRRKNNIYKAVGGVGVVVVVVVVIIAISLTGTTKKPSTSAGLVGGEYDIPASLVAKVEAVPVKTLVGSAGAVPRSAWSAPGPGDATPPQALPLGNKQLVAGGKPEIVYIASEYCPFCAAERWALVMALSKFGTFSGLHGTSSSATDVNPSTPTFSFYGSSFRSSYISFSPVETETNTGAKLQDPTAAQLSLLDKWDAPPYVSSSQQSGSIPFLYMSGKYLSIGAQYDAGVLSGMQFSKAANYLTSGTNPTAKAAMAAAGYLVGDICALTAGRPASVCSQVPKDLVGVNTTSRTASSRSVSSH